MLLTILTPKISPIGLDLGERTVRAAQLRKEGEKYCVTKVAQSERTLNTSEKEPVERSMRRLFDGAGFKGRSVRAALNPPDVEFHVLEIPQAALQTPENCDQLIHYEVGRLSSIPQEQLETRHWLLPARSGPTALSIGISATREKIVRLLNRCGDAGLRCRCVGTGATALHRFGQLLHPWPEGVIWGLLDLGARQTRLVLCSREVPILIRHTGSGGDLWTERIAESLQISQSSAEIQKRTHGVAGLHRRGERSEPAASSQDEVSSMLLGALRGELNEIATEIKRSYEYVLGSYPGKRAGDLVLVGGGAGMPNLPGFLGGMLGIPVKRAASYLEGSQCQLRFPAGHRTQIEEFALAIGLAAGEARA